MELTITGNDIQLGATVFKDRLLMDSHNFGQ